MAENNGRADNRTPLRYSLSFEKWYLVVSPILTDPGGFHLLGILSLAKMYSSLQGTCIVCEKAHLSSVKSREAAEPAFASASGKCTCMYGGGGWSGEACNLTPTDVQIQSKRCQVLRFHTYLL